MIKGAKFGDKIIYKLTNNTLVSGSVISVMTGNDATCCTVERSIRHAVSGNPERNGSIIDYIYGEDIVSFNADIETYVRHKLNGIKFI